MSDTALPFCTDRVRVQLLLKRRDGMSKEEFSRYWLQIHGPLFASLDIVKKNILKYDQGHIDSSNSAQQFHTAMGAPQTEFDGISSFEVESYEKLQEVFMSQEYAEKVFEDEKEFLDRAKCKLVLQQLYTVIDVAS